MENAEIKKLAVESNKQTWVYLQKTELDQAEKIQMLTAAYASLYLWARCGTTLHLARAHWLIQRVACVLQEKNLALRHAELCEAYTNQSADKKDFDQAYVFEAFARAYALNENLELAEKFKIQAQQAGEKIADPEDKKIFLADAKA